MRKEILVDKGIINNASYKKLKYEQFIKNINGQIRES